MTMRDRSIYIWSVSVLAIGVGLQVFFLLRGFYSIGWDEAGRTLDAYAWAKHGVVLVRAWLPFYRVCVGLGLSLHPDLVITPRIITFAYGLGAMLAMAWLAHELFQSRKVTRLTLFLSAFAPQRIALSLAPLSDIMFIDVILATTALLARWSRLHQTHLLWSCALLGALATTLRYEGWIFAAILFLIVVRSERSALSAVRRRDVLVVGLILFLFPVAWAVGTFFTTNPLAVVKAAVRTYGLRDILRKNPLVEFILANGVSLNLIGLMAIIHFMRRGPWRLRAIIAASFLPLLIASLILLLTHSAQTGPSWRMIGVWSMLLLPFTAWTLVGTPWASAPVRGRRALAIAVTALVLTAFVYDIFAIERTSFWAFPESDRLAGRYLDERIRAHPATKILIESSGYYFLNIEVASQHPDAFVQNSVPERKSVPLLPLGGRVRDALDSRGINILVFRTEAYKADLNRRSDVERLADFGPWSIYELKPSPPRTE